MYNVDIFVDGACSPNGSEGSVGGWAAILQCAGREKVLSGHTAATTSNRVELTAVIEAVRAVTKPSSITVHTASTYVAEAPTRVRSWISRGWKTKGGSTPKNLDLWRDLIAVGNQGQHKISFVVDTKPDRELTARCTSIAKEQRLVALAGRGVSV